MEDQPDNKISGIEINSCSARAFVYFVWENVCFSESFMKINYALGNIIKKLIFQNLGGIRYITKNIP